MHRRLLLPAVLALCFSASLALAQRQAPETFSGRVVAVTDGDTLGVLRDGKEVKVRLHGIDAPETGQAFGSVAKSGLSDRVYDKAVTIRLMGVDRYKRLLGVVSIGPGPSVNEALVKDGLAWWFHQYGETDRHLALAEIDARAARKGLWKDEYPVPPWIFRHPEKVAAGDGSRPRVAESTVGNGRAPKPAAAVAPQGLTVYITRTGSKYHRDGCRHLKSRIASTVADAQAKGLAACGVCRP